MSQLQVVIEQDGPRFRWALVMVGSDIPAARRLAKGARWWNTEEEAEADAEEFCRAVPQARIVKP